MSSYSKEIILELLRKHSYLIHSIDKHFLTIKIEHKFLKTSLIKVPIDLLQYKSEKNDVLQKKINILQNQDKYLSRYKSIILHPKNNKNNNKFIFSGQWTCGDINYIEAILNINNPILFIYSCDYSFDSLDIYKDKSSSSLICQKNKKLLKIPLNTKNKFQFITNNIISANISIEWNKCDDLNNWLQKKSIVGHFNNVFNDIYWSKAVYFLHFFNDSCIVIEYRFLIMNDQLSVKSMQLLDPNNPLKEIKNPIQSNLVKFSEIKKNYPRIKQIKMKYDGFIDISVIFDKQCF